MLKDMPNFIINISSIYKLNTCPLSMTRILSEEEMVSRRWAIVSTVQLDS